MNPPTTLLLPAPGPAFGAYPERPEPPARADGGGAPADEPRRAAPPVAGRATAPGWRGFVGLVGRRDASAAGFVARVRRARQRLPAEGSGLWLSALTGLRADLGLHGLGGEPLERAFATVLALVDSRLGVALHDTQLQAARLLLDDRLVEMATGEGKTHAAVLAAAVAALAGVPVHVVTANPYLAARDAALAAPLYRALALRGAAVGPADDDATRRAAWACDIVHTAPRELIFDYLRDRCRAAGAPALLRGLCMAIVDEADSVLVDDARTPFILAEERRDTTAERRWRAALAAARRLADGRHFTRDERARRCTLTPEGRRACPAAAGPERDPLWRHDHHRAELVETALAALHLWRRDVHYLVQGGAAPAAAAAVPTAVAAAAAVAPAGAPAAAAVAAAATRTAAAARTAAAGPADAACAAPAAAPSVEIIDPTTGRVTPGRRWAAGLHQLIELKEGLTPSPVQHTLAQLGFQRFFARYWRLAGTSGTLADARRELRAVYARAVAPVALRVPSRRRDAGDYLFADDRTRWPMVVRAVVRQHATGRPVLVGCDTLADADRLCRLLDGQGLAHQRLDARQDADEAARVAAAGQRGAITVATRIAGRGTDIRLGDGVAALGGLFVVDAQANGSRRVDRQLHGRCARGGEPGAVLRLQALDAGVFAQALPAPLRRALAAWARRRRAAHLPPWLAGALRTALQARVQARERAERQALLQHDRESARRLGFGATAP